jgi:hypothetical protein
MIEKTITFTDEDGQRIEVFIDFKGCINISIENGWIIMQPEDFIKFFHNCINTIQTYGDKYDKTEKSSC